MSTQCKPLLSFSYCRSCNLKVYCFTPAANGVVELYPTYACLSVCDTSS